MKVGSAAGKHQSFFSSMWSLTGYVILFESVNRAYFACKIDLIRFMNYLYLKAMTLDKVNLLYSNCQ